MFRSKHSPLSKEYGNMWITKQTIKMSSACVNFTRLVNKLYELNCISSDDKETLEIQKISLEKFSFLCTKVCKNSRGFTNLIIAYVCTENDGAVKLLTGKTIDDLNDLGITPFTRPQNISIHVVKDDEDYRVAYLVTTDAERKLSVDDDANFPKDFQVQDLHINPICDIIKDHEALLSQHWGTVITDWLGQRDNADLRRILGQGLVLFVDIVSETIMRWTKKEKTSATFQRLVSYFESKGVSRLSDELKSRKGYIFRPHIE